MSEMQMKQSVFSPTAASLRIVNGVLEVFARSRGGAPKGSWRQRSESDRRTLAFQVIRDLRPVARAAGRDDLQTRFL